MRNYDYLHQGITDGNAAVPGRSYTIQRTHNKVLKKLIGSTLLATKQTATFDDGDGPYEARLFVNVATGGVVYLNSDVIIS
jgi:hypothetical protein